MLGTLTGKSTGSQLTRLGTGICQGACNGHTRVQNFVLSDTYSFNNTTILDADVSYLRNSVARTPKLSNFNVTSLGQPAAFQSQIQFPGPPVMVIAGFDTANTFGSQGADSTITGASDKVRVAGNVTKLLGNHTLKVGGEFFRGTFYQASDNISSGIFRFNPSFTSKNPLTGGGGAGLASFLLGYPNAGSANTVTAIAATQFYPAVYADDQWRVTQHLTLHMGLRWENNLPWTERHNNLSYFDPTSPNPILTAAGAGSYPGTIGLVASSSRPSRSNSDTYLSQYSPRVGFTYGVSSQTVLSRWIRHILAALRLQCRRGTYRRSHQPVQHTVRLDRQRQSNAR